MMSQLMSRHHRHPSNKSRNTCLTVCPSIFKRSSDLLRTCAGMLLRSLGSAVFCMSGIPPHKHHFTSCNDKCYVQWHNIGRVTWQFSTLCWCLQQQINQIWVVNMVFHSICPELWARAGISGESYFFVCLANETNEQTLLLLDHACLSRWQQNTTAFENENTPLSNSCFSGVSRTFVPWELNKILNSDLSG